MGKLLIALEKQLKTENKQAAEDCLLIYNALQESNGGHVWGSQWNQLVVTTWDGYYPNSKRISTPSSIGRMYLVGIKEAKKL